MYSKELLKKRFADAGLELQLLPVPIGRGDVKEIFQMTIGRNNRRKNSPESFRIWPGHKNNRVEVLSVEPKLRQLTLLVHEPARTFTTRDWRGNETTHTTPGNKRHLLCGFDERNLFIAQLPNSATTVQDAHASLKSESVADAEKKRSGRTVRQGEWFFVETTLEEREAIERDSKNNIHKKVRIGAGGKPHVADEMVRLFGGTVYIRGKVRHPDHKTVHFSHWRRVIRNTELDARPAGVAWVD